MLIIGSVAAHHWFSDWRLPRDVDVLSPEVSPVPMVIDYQWHEMAEKVLAASKHPVFADPDILLTLKLSHSHWNIWWKKTVIDITLLKDRGARVNEGLYRELLPVWERVHGKKHVNLNTTVSEFFDDNVTRRYDHEALHHHLALDGPPAHMKARTNKDSPWLTEKDAVSNGDLREVLALEEIMVTAVERADLGSASTYTDIVKAIDMAHRVLATSMSKGWFSRYLVWNYRDLSKQLRERGVPHLKKQLKSIENVKPAPRKEA